MTANHHEPWTFKKEINITHIIATLPVVVSAIIFGSSVDKRIDLNATNIQHVMTTQAKTDQRYKEFRHEMKNDISGINDKLDRLLERRSEQR
ncbi:hypothetical protein KCM76_22430 [Zooshikella marina]|uniref:hypothetical protein n=1 Tax=Zooshikella ganghwensis TaxID=202772 RepID=UPI001BAF2546|nr:hypothetical protein [Zooshikella ganghwensis]MBU2708767.1 hypothetical protein [Zooshikella ganghwensis]